MVEPLEIRSYDPRWVLEFQAERSRIAATLGDLARRIDHHGSTSVPGLAAKPIIDIQVSVEQLSVRVLAARLGQLGYVHLPHADDAFSPFFHRPGTWPHTHHVHAVQAGGIEERRTLAFRDYLREHRDVSREYEALKRRLAARSDAADPSSREAYASAKGEFVERVVQAALAAGYPQHMTEGIDGISPAVWPSRGRVITIRPERPEDAARVRLVNELAFGQPAEADLVERLRRSCRDSLSLVAEDDAVVGHILFTPVAIEGGGRRVLGMGLAPLAVLPDRQRQTIGSQLVRKGLDVLRERGCPFVVVIGHPEYYPRFGFEPASSHGLASQWEGVPDAAFMVLMMDGPAMAGVSGVAKYGEEFNEVV